MLDSSPPPAQIFPPRRPLKRSASAASLASLPTPPGSADKRTSRRVDSSDEDDIMMSGDEDRRTRVAGRATGKRLKLTKDEDDSNPFWVPPIDDLAAKIARTTARSPSPSRASSSTVVAPLSPPKSKRGRQKVRRMPLDGQPPVTPRPKASAKGTNHPIRDTPNNPFLVSSPAAHPPVTRLPSDPADHEEKPTITYVFRGVKTTFANPLYGLPPDADAASRLPANHPDYSPPAIVRPRRLFTEDVATRWSDDEDDDMKLKPTRLFAEELRVAEQLDSRDISRMALGPPRPKRL